MSEFQVSVARRFIKNMNVAREAIFGVDDPMPLANQDDAMVMFPGALGSAYKPGKPVLIGINPGGGGDTYVPTPMDHELYPILRRLKLGSICEETEVVQAIKDMSEIYFRAQATWNIHRIFKPVIEAAGVEESEVAFLNAVPYRTRDNKAPRVAAKRNAWTLVTEPLLDVLQPGCIIALGKQAGDCLERFYEGPARCFVVPRTIGDSYISDKAHRVLELIKAHTVGQE